MMPADVRPACADDLALVDAAFERGKAGNQAARELAVLCRSCSCADSCLRELVQAREHGVWGGTRRRANSAGSGGRLGTVKAIA